MPFCDLLPMVHPNDIVFDGTNNCTLCNVLTSDTEKKLVRVWEFEVKAEKSDPSAASKTLHRAEVRYIIIGSLFIELLLSVI